MNSELLTCCYLQGVGPAGHPVSTFHSNQCEHLNNIVQMAKVM